MSNNTPAADNRWNYQWARLDNDAAEIFADWIHPTRLEDFRAKRVLDAGCGKGSYARLVAQVADEVVGLDKYAIEAARANVGDCANIKLVAGLVTDRCTFPPKRKVDVQAPSKYYRKSRHFLIRRKSCQVSYVICQIYRPNLTLSWGT